MSSELHPLGPDDWPIDSATARAPHALVAPDRALLFFTCVTESHEQLYMAEFLGCRAASFAEAGEESAPGAFRIAESDWLPRELQGSKLEHFLVILEEQAFECLAEGIRVEPIESEVDALAGSRP